MEHIEIKLHSNFKSKATLKDVHGNFPYKCYIELLGATNLGKYIAIVGSKALGINPGDKVSLEVDLGRANDLLKSNQCFGKVVLPMELKEEKFLVFEKEQKK